MQKALFPHITVLVLLLAAGVAAHADDASNAEAERPDLLTFGRAQAVVDNLIERGFAAANISATGEGESQPLVSPDTTETARELNRRVEISCSADNG